MLRLRLLKVSKIFTTFLNTVFATNTRFLILNIPITVAFLETFFFKTAMQLSQA